MTEREAPVHPCHTCQRAGCPPRCVGLTWPGRRLGDALLRTRIGDRPSDEDLKARLLGA